MGVLKCYQLIPPNKMVEVKTYESRETIKILVVCLTGARPLLRPEKKSSSRLSGGCRIVITTGKKKIQSSVWRVRDRYYDWKKKKF